MLKFETETTITGSCENCPLREDCDQLTQYTICELLNSKLWLTKKNENYKETITVLRE